MKLSNIFIFSILFLLPTICLSLTIEGQILDSMGSPIQDAYILKKDGSFHALTNELGHFICKNVKVGDTLIISYLGFETVQLVVREQNAKETMRIVLKEKRFDLSQVFVSNSVKALNQIADIDLKTNPVASSQEILRKVPGLFIGQHAGGGKAEQLFLRGFDIDHGTDVNISVDGMPVNMVSHAHGQGYSDLHFLIPETIQRLSFGKGPYYANKGNFTTAGYVDFQTKERLENSLLGLETGQFNTLRTVALIDLLGKIKNQHAYFAGEYIISDGPFESPQNFNRLNLMGKYTLQLPDDDKIAFLASHFNSRWGASGQIPQRAVSAGMITRFGAIDDTEGGKTNRTNMALIYLKNVSNQSFIKSKVYFSNYNFELFSNFTFFLEDPENGDQIRQTESRNIIGLESVFHRTANSSFTDIHFQGGIGLRHDRVNDLELAHTLNKETNLFSLAKGAVRESNIYSFLNTEFDFGKVLINPGLRLDFFNFGYQDKLLPIHQSLSQSKIFVSPKLNVIYNPTPQLQLFLKSGIGFHSNDTRVVTAQNGKEVLPGAFGTDIGAVWKPRSRLWFNTALWYLYMKQEFVYVGDAGIVEPSGRTRRTGIDLSMRWQLSKSLFFDTDFNYTFARLIDEPEGADLIPLAPEFTTTGGFDFQFPSGFSGGIHYRYIKDRPANEDNSITAKGYFITDVNVNYAYKKIQWELIIQNLFNAEWNEAQFATISRLQGEVSPVEELHFTPGTPFFIKGKVIYSF